MTTFYRTTIKLEVLSDESIIECDPETILQACEDGPCVLAIAEAGQRQVTPAEMARMLHEAGSEPGFFMLDDEGNEVEG